MSKFAWSDSPTLPPDERKLLKIHIAHPEIFMRQRLNFFPWEKQIDIAYSVRDYKETMVKSCNGAGKTQVAAAIALWWLLTRKSKVVTTAPTARQVEDLLWGAIGSMSKAVEGLGIEALTTRINVDKEWYATGLSTNDPSRFQGYHGNVLVIVDEAAGVTEGPIWEAIQGNLTGGGDRLLAIGNPTDPNTEFARRCKMPGKNRNVITISAFDTPNVQQGREVIPGGITREWVEEQKENYGVGSPFWQARVMGEFPDQTDASLFPLAWLTRAFEYDPQRRGDVSEGTGQIGMDIGGSGADNNALAYRTGGKLHRVHGWQSIDTTDLVDDLYEWIDQYMPDRVMIDAIGVGTPIYDYAKKKKREDYRWRSVKIRPFKSRPHDVMSPYINDKAEAYVKLRNLLREGKVDWSNVDPQMRTAIEKQTNAIRYRMDAKGRWQIEDKRVMRAREGFSPDELEAVIYAYAGSEGKVSRGAVADVDYTPPDDPLDNHDMLTSFEYDFGRYERATI